MLGWLCILVLALANGALREGLLIPRMGAVAGTALSGLTLSAAAAVVPCLLLRWRPAASVAQAGWMGAGWLVATLIFEFAFGGLVQGKSLPDLLSAYTFQNGNLWPVVLVTVTVAPYLCARRSDGRAHDTPRQTHERRHP